MPGIKRRKCRHCCELFIADARNATRQRYCSKPQCRKASTAASQKRWLQKDENRDYFRGPDNVLRVQRWRQAHPGYWRQPKHSSLALQDPLTRQVTVNKQDTSNFASVALQDALIMQPAVVIGLIAQFTGYALQDDIAMAARRMQQLGNDILNPQPKGGSKNDFLLNLFVPRFGADPAAVAEMKKNYNTTGQLSIPLVTMHTTLDQQVPYFHEFLYNLKTISQGSFWTEHVNFPINRFGHCNFTPDEALLGFGLMLLYAGEMDTLEGVGSMLRGEELSSFESLAERFGLPYSVGGNKLRLK